MTDGTGRQEGGGMGVVGKAVMPDVSFTFKESDVRNLIGTSALQTTLKDVVGEMKNIRSWVSGELSAAKADGEKQRQEDKQEMNKKLEEAKQEVMDQAKKA